MAIASMILGILSITSGNLIYAILALVFSSKAKAVEGQTSFSQAGMICGIIGLVLSILVAIVAVLYLAILIVSVWSMGPFYY